MTRGYSMEMGILSLMKVRQLELSTTDEVSKRKVSESMSRILILK